MPLNNNIPTSYNYQQLMPSPLLVNFVDSYWQHINHSNIPVKMTILPDGFFKAVFYIVKDNIDTRLLTGLWPKQIEVIIPAKARVIGIRFKILASEYLFKKNIATLLQSLIEPDTYFWDLKKFSFDNFEQIVDQIEPILINKLPEESDIPVKKLKLSQLLYNTAGNITSEEVANEINWSNRQINRYLNKYLGVSLKTYLNILKCYTTFSQIRDGNLFPDKGYFDQAHFIREVKKHTGHSPKILFKGQDDRFIQLKGVKRK